MSDVLIIGAGPAGMSAALALRGYGLSVTVADDQPAPGGRIFAAIETREVHGAEDKDGADLAARFRADGGAYLPETEAWGIEPAPRVFLSRKGRATMMEPRFILLATGAQERPMPFPGWQLPGVMTVGAAQILLKTAKQIPDQPVWLAGTGPLLFLYARQLRAAGGTVAGILDTTPPGSKRASVGLFAGGLRYGWRDLLRGIGWLSEMRDIRVIRNVQALEALGADKLTTVRYSTGTGENGEVETALLLVHDGVVPAVHTTMAAGCSHRWNVRQQCFQPDLNAFHGSSNPAIYVAGDGGSIAGAKAATYSGRLAAIGIAHAAGKLTDAQAETAARPFQKKLAAAEGFRRLVDSLYPPSKLGIPDATMVCRCEEITASQIRAAAKGRPHLGPDGVKIETRAGMGPCQGRQCGLSLTRLLAETHNLPPADVGFLRIRSPLKPLTLGELATLEATS